MLESRVIALSNGDEVRLDSSPSSLSFQLLDPVQNPIGGPVSLFQQQVQVDTVQQIDGSTAAALSGGGFLVAFEERSTLLSGGNGGISSETVNLAVFDGDGHQTGTFALPAGDVPAGSAPNIGAFALSGGGFAAVFDHHDGPADTLHLAYSDGNGGLTDLALPGQAFHVVNAGGALSLGFADGSQVTVGGAGAETLQASDKGDIIRAGGGNDVIQGGAGSDDINGNGGSDTLAGGAGAETLRGGQGDDVISGGAGDDFISGDRGNDTETGGGGADIFHASGNSGLDVVNDFDAAQGDRVLLDHGTAFTMEQSGSDVIVHLGSDQNTLDSELILKNVQLSTLPQGFILLG